jgi:acyl dehydratase
MLNTEVVLNWKFNDIVQTYTRRDTILYALGLGLGDDPLDRGNLRYCLEKTLVAFPTMPVVLGTPPYWYSDPKTGIDWVKTLQGEQGLKIFKPLPPEGTVIGRNRVSDVIDKGPGKGALICMERDIVDQATGELLATRTSVSFARNDGGCGGTGRKAPEPFAIPDTKPDASMDIATRDGQALLYRLNGDWNPIHADPDTAKKAGYDRPILHGLCTYGLCARAIVQLACGGDPARLRAIEGRFSKHVFPGDTLRVELWNDGGSVAFRARVMNRDAVVFNNGRAEIGR